MASPTKVFKTRNKLKQRKAGADRKKALAKGTTPPREIFFGDVPATPARNK